MIRFLSGFFYFLKKEENKIIAQAKIDDDDRSEVEFLSPNGLVRKPKDKERSIIIQDNEEKKYYVLKTEGASIPELEAGEVVVYYDADNFIKITNNKKIKIQLGANSFFEIMNELIDKIKSNQVITQFGPQTITPNSVTQMDLIKQKLAEVME